MTIDLDDTTLAQWESVKAHYRDFAGDAMERNIEQADGIALGFREEMERYVRSV